MFIFTLNKSREKLADSKLFNCVSIWSILSHGWILLLLYLSQKCNIEIWKAAFSIVLYLLYLLVYCALHKKIQTKTDCINKCENEILTSVPGITYPCDYESLNAILKSKKLF